MAENKRNAIDILFQVKGEGNISGESGQLIKRQLEKIGSEISAKSPIKVKFIADTSELDKSIDKIRKKAEETKASSRKNGNSNAAKEEAVSYEDAEKALDKLYKAKSRLQKQKTDTTSFKLMNDEVAKQEKAYDTIVGKLKEANGEQATGLTQLKERRDALEKLLKVEGTATEGARAKLEDKATSLFTDNGFDKIIARSRKARLEAENFRKAVNEAFYDEKTGKPKTVSKEKLEELNGQFLRARANIKKFGEETETAGTKFSRAFGDKTLQIAVAALAGYLAVKIREVYKNVVELDKAVTNLQIATGYTRNETKKLVQTYADLAKQMGATVTDVTEGADTWLRQGYSVAETNLLIKDTLMLSKLGQIDSAEAAKALTSAMKGYKISVEDATKIVDKFTAVDMEAAVSAGDIAKAMAETATGADIAGVSMDKLIGYISTVAEVTQDGAESVGIFYKALFARMGNVKAGRFVDDETGESLNDVEKVLGKLGISLRERNGDFRNFGVVLDEVGQKWNSYSNVQQRALATAFAGTRQSEKFVVLMENYGKAMEYANVAANSMGTAETKYSEAYLEGIDAKLNNLTASSQKLSTMLLDSELVKGGIAFLQGILDVLTALATPLDGMLVQVPLLTVAASALVALLAQTITSGLWVKLISNLGLVLRYVASFGLYLAQGTVALIRWVALRIAKTEILTAANYKLAASQQAVNATNPIGWIILAISLIISIVFAIRNFVKSTNDLKEASLEAAKALQEEADRMKEISDSSQGAVDALDELIKKTRELKDEMTAYDWYNNFKQMGEGIAKLYPNESLTPLQAINRLLGTAYTYDELITKGIEDKLKILSEIEKKAQAVTNQALKETYETQARATEAKTSAVGQKEHINVNDHDTVRFLNEGGRDLLKVAGINLYNRGGKDFLEVDNSQGVVDSIDKVKTAMKVLEDRWKFSPEALANSSVYKKLKEWLSEMEEALKAEKDSLSAYIAGVVKLKGFDIKPDFNVNDSDLKEKYDEYINKFIEALKTDDTISNALSKEIIGETDLLEMAEGYVANTYTAIYEKVKGLSQELNVYKKTALGILNEVSEQFDALTKAQEEMDSAGILSADSIKALTEKFPELSKYVTETADGYKLLGGAVGSFMDETSQGYIDDIEKAKAAYETAVAEYNKKFEAGTETVEDEEKVDKLKEQWDNAIENAKTWRMVQNTLYRDSLIDEYTKKLNKQSDALKKQQEAYEELCDVRKDLLSTYEEEIKYKDELNKKQRNVADLQTQLSLAQLDNSAAGRAKARELQAQLEDAQAELDEYTLEHAIDDLLADIDEGNAEYKKFIDGHLKAIEEAIKNIPSKSTTEIATNNGTTGGVNSTTDGKLAKEIADSRASATEKLGSARSTDSSENKEPTKSGTPGMSGSVEWDVMHADDSNGFFDPRYADQRIGTDGLPLNFWVWGQGLASSDGAVSRGEAVARGSDLEKKIEKLAGTESTKYGKMVLLNEELYVLDKENLWKKVIIPEKNKDAIMSVYKKNLKTNPTTPAYHSGGFVDNFTALKSNETFAKLLKGELVSTPKQMDNFIKNVVPKIAIAGATAHRATIEYNSPLVTIQCGNIAEDSLPGLNDIVNKAVAKIKKDMTSALSRTGYRKPF